MKGNKKILVAALLLLLISVSFGTYAIYRSNATATGTLTPAKWSVKLDGNEFQSASFTFTAADLVCDTNPAKASGTIAPGALCHIDIPVDADGSQVDVVLTAEIDTNASTVTDDWEVGLAQSQISIPYSATEGQMEKTVTINVEWPGAESDTTAKDTADKSLGASPAAKTIVVNLTAKQTLS